MMNFSKKMRNESRLRICILIPNNVAGGAERVLTTLSNQFAKMNQDVYLISFDENDQKFYEINPDVHVENLCINSQGKHGAMKWIMIGKYYKALLKVIKRIAPDVVISFLFITNIVGGLCCRRLHIPIVLSERNDPKEYSIAQKKAMRIVYPWANGFVCQSHVVKDTIEKIYNIHNALVISNPLNETQVSTLMKTKTDRIIAAGRFVPQKDFKLLIDAFSELTADYPNYRLSIYGDGYLRDELEKQIKDLGLQDVVELPGIIKDAIKVNNDAKIFVLSSRFEGYPNVLVEAMANGLICIASDVASGTVRTLIQEGKNGFIFPVGDKDALITCMRTAMDDSKNFSEMIYHARKIIDKTSVDKIANMWLDYLSQVLQIYEGNKR